MCVCVCVCVCFRVFLEMGHVWCHMSDSRHARGASVPCWCGTTLRGYRSSSSRGDRHDYIEAGLSVEKGGSNPGFCFKPKLGFC